MTNIKTAFLFSGQGSQKPGMTQELYQNSKVARKVFESVENATQIDVAKLCFCSTQQELNKTQNAQIAVFTSNMAACADFQEKGIMPDFVAGFSLGEYSALVCCSALTIEQGAKIVQKRANIMANASGGIMMAVLGAEISFLQQQCEKTKGYVVCVNYNCPGQTVVSGEKSAVLELEQMLKEQKIRTSVLPVSAAFHSEMMNESAQLLNEELQKIKFENPKIPIILNTTAKPYVTGEAFSNIMTQQCKSPVLWQQSIEELLRLGATNFVECGHGKVLSGFVKRIVKENQIQNVTIL